MLIDCDACVMRGPGCRDCVVTVLLGAPAEPTGSMVIDEEERAALAVLAESGLVPPLRLVHAVSTLEPGLGLDDFGADGPAGPGPRAADAG